MENRNYYEQLLKESVDNIFVVPKNYIDDELIVHCIASIKNYELFNGKKYFKIANYDLNQMIGYSFEYVDIYKYKNDIYEIIRRRKEWKKDEYIYLRSLFIEHFDKKESLHSLKKNATFPFGFPQHFKNDEDIMIALLKNTDNYHLIGEELNNLEFHKKIYDIYENQFYKNKMRKFIINYL